MIFDFLLRRSRAVRDPEIAEAESRVGDLENRADNVIPRLLAEGQRNHFAERLRLTFPRTNGA